MCFSWVYFFGLDISLWCHGDESISGSHRVSLSLSIIYHLRWGTACIHLQLFLVIRAALTCNNALPMRSQRIHLRVRIIYFFPGELIPYPAISICIEKVPCGVSP